MLFQAKALRNEMHGMKYRKERRVAKDLLHELETIGPFTGLGFFNIERRTITSMVSVAITYLFILVQFKMVE